MDEKVILGLRKTWIEIPPSEDLKKIENCRKLKNNGNKSDIFANNTYITRFFLID
jgi:hypothetical protein